MRGEGRSKVRLKIFSLSLTKQNFYSHGWLQQTNKSKNYDKLELRFKHILVSFDRTNFCYNAPFGSSFHLSSSAQNVLPTYYQPVTIYCQKRWRLVKLIMMMMHPHVHHPSRCIVITTTDDDSILLFDLCLISMHFCWRGSRSLDLKKEGWVCHSQFLRVRKVFAHIDKIGSKSTQNSLEIYRTVWKVSVETWKVFRGSGKFSEGLESFQTVWKVSGQFGEFSEDLENFQTVWKVSRQSRNFLDNLEGLQPICKRQRYVIIWTKSLKLATNKV